jgi:AAA domain
MNDWQEFRDQLLREPSTSPHPQAKRQLAGGSAIHYAQKIIDPGSCLLGNRYLTRGSGMFFVAPSGQGKSTAVMQATVCWCCGRESFDILPSRPIRINLIQAEDDDADLTDMAKVIDYLHFSGPELELIEKNSWIETINDKVGTDAIRAIDDILEARPCDLVILNPYTAYLGASIMDDEANSLFLRRDLQAMLNRHNCAALPVHHTPKTNFRSRTDKWSTMDWMYSGAGAAVLTNWARAILAMEPVGESGVYKFIAAKRGQRIGWTAKINYFRHDSRPGVLLWTKANEEEIAAGQSSAKRRTVLPISKLITFLPEIGGLGMMELREKVMESGISRRAFDDSIQMAIETGKVQIEYMNKGKTRWKNVSRPNASQINFETNGA